MVIMVIPIPRSPRCQSLPQDLCQDELLEARRCQIWNVGTLWPGGSAQRGSHFLESLPYSGHPGYLNLPRPGLGVRSFSGRVSEVTTIHLGTRRGRPSPLQRAAERRPVVQFDTASFRLGSAWLPGWPKSRVSPSQPRMYVKVALPGAALHSSLLLLVGMC